MSVSSDITDDGQVLVEIDFNINAVYLLNMR